MVGANRRRHSDRERESFLFLLSSDETTSLSPSSFFFFLSILLPQLLCGAFLVKEQPIGLSVGFSLSVSFWGLSAEKTHSFHWKWVKFESFWDFGDGINAAFLFLEDDHALFSCLFWTSFVYLVRVWLFFWVIMCCFGFFSIVVDGFLKFNVFRCLWCSACCVWSSRTVEKNGPLHNADENLMLFVICIHSNASFVGCIRQSRCFVVLVMCFMFILWKFKLVKERFMSMVLFIGKWELGD